MGSFVWTSLGETVQTNSTCLSQYGRNQEEDAGDEGGEGQCNGQR